MSKEYHYLPTNHELLEHMSDAVLLVSSDGTIIQTNELARKLLHLQDEATNIDHYLDFHSLRKNKQYRLIMRSKRCPKNIFEVTVLPSDQSYIYLCLNEVSLKETIPEVKHHIDQLAATSSEGLIMVCKNGKIIDCDYSLACMFHFTVDALKNLSLTSLVRESERYKLLQLLESQKKRIEHFQGVTKKGEHLHLKITKLSPTNDLLGAMIAKIENVTEQRKAKTKLEYMENHDILTGLPNRTYLFNQLEMTIKEATDAQETFALLHIHLNHLKQINETFGYDVGDQLLKTFSENLTNYLKHHIFTARLTSNEFIILLRNTDSKTSVTTFVENLINHLSSTYHIKGYDIQISLNIGISLYPEHGLSAEELLKNADAALYMVRDNADKQFNFYESSLSKKFKLNLKMDSELHQALASNQFSLHYQPQKCLTTGKVIGLEALLRWNHPTKGLIPPLEFIPLAEKTGLIIDIGRWVLYEACKQNKHWQNQGYRPVIVSVNLSAKQLHQKDFVKDVEKILQLTNLEPHYLELEITESMAMMNEKFVLKTVKKLRKLGVFVSIDDFGTGYSSLKSLSFFPVTKLKIDKMFMDERQKHNRTIVRSIIRLSHSLNLKVIAEGVETLEQMKFLKEEKCDEIQGFYFSKPLPAQQLPQFFQTI